MYRLKWKKAVIWLIIPIVAVLAGILGEVLYNTGFDKEIISLKDETVRIINFTEKEDGVYYSSGDGGYLQISFEKRFVDKLKFKYDYGGFVVFEMNCTASVDGDDVQTSELEVKESNSHVLSGAVINIHDVADHIEIYFPEGTGPITISQLEIDNSGNVSRHRFLFTTLCTFFAMCVIVILWKKIYIPLEKIFAAIVLSFGLVCIVSVPVHKLGLDEEIHFGRAYFLAESFLGEEEIEFSLGVRELINVTATASPSLLPNSEEELLEENIFWNTAGDPSRNSELKEDISDYMFHWNLSSVAYFFQWLMIEIAVLLKLPFIWVVKMGQMGNLFLYCVLVYFAIRHISKGKKIFFVLALMPTALMSAITYTYDGWVNGFCFLGASYLFEEWICRDRKLSYKNLFVIIVSFVLASFPKAVYIPLVLPIIFMPGNKFNSKKEMYIMKGITSVAFVLMMSTFVLPTVFNPTGVESDSRGGDTSVALQLKYIFEHPIRYANLLLGSIKETFLRYIMGREGLGTMGYLGIVPSEGLIGLVIGYSVLLEEKDGTKLLWFQRLIGLGTVFVVICLIWTALYLAYTPVGLSEINGVQGRYYLPVTIWILWFLQTEKLQCRFEKYKDNAIIAVLSLLLLIPIIYNGIIIKTF